MPRKHGCARKTVLGQFKVRALSRNPGKHRDLADEIIEADLARPEALKAAFEGAHRVFLVTRRR